MLPCRDKKKRKKVEDADVQIALPEDRLGDFIFPKQENMWVLCLQDLNSFHFKSESAVFTAGHAPMCLTQPKDRLWKKERE